MPIEIFQIPEASEFSSEKRVNAVYFHYPYEEVDDIKLHLPPGYKVEGLPQPKKVDLRAVCYQITAAARAQIQSKSSVICIESNLSIRKDQYPTFRKFFEIVRTDDTRKWYSRMPNRLKIN